MIFMEMVEKELETANSKCHLLENISEFWLEENKKTNGIIGVPITFLGNYCLNQFNIIGMSSSAGYNKEIVGIEKIKDGDARPLINGKNTYARILIQRKESNYDS